MMKQLVFVVDDIIVAYHKPIYNMIQVTSMNKQLVQLYVDWNHMYLFSQRDEFTESNLKAFKVCKFN